MYGRRVRRNDDAQEILDTFIAMLDAKSPRRAGIVRRNKQMFLDFIRSELAKPSTSAFKVGETLLSESPHDPGYPMEVIYRGKVGDKATVAYDGGRQMTVPLAWLSRPAKSQPKVTPQASWEDVKPKEPERVDPSNWDGELATFGDGEIATYYKEFDDVWAVLPVDGETGVKFGSVIRYPREKFRTLKSVISNLENRYGPKTSQKGISFDVSAPTAWTVDTARQWVRDTVDFMLTMPLVSDPANWIGEGKNRRGDQPGLNGSTEGPILAFKEYMADPNLPNEFYFGAVSTLGLHKNTQLNPEDWQEAFNALKNVSSVTEEQARTLIHAEVEEINTTPGEQGAVTREGKWKKRGGNYDFEFGQKQDRNKRISTKALSQAGFVKGRDYDWDVGYEDGKKYFRLRVYPHALERFLVFLSDRYPTLATTAKPYLEEAKQEAEERQEAEEIEAVEKAVEVSGNADKGVAGGIDYVWDKDQFRIVFNLEKAGIHGKGFVDEVRQAGGNANFGRIDNSWQGYVNTNALNDFIPALRKMGPRWQTFADVFEQYTPEWSAIKAELVQSREGGSAEGGRWKLFPNYNKRNKTAAGREAVKVYLDYLMPEEKDLLGLGAFKLKKGMGGWGYILKPSKIPTFADAIRPKFPRLAEALNRAYGGIAQAMDEEREKCRILANLADAKSPEEVTDPDARKEVNEVARILKRNLPEGLSPFPFQLIGITFAKVSGFRALIGDSMGLGKTIQGIGTIAVDPKENLPALIVAPANTTFAVWQKESEKWLSKLGVPAIVLSTRQRIPKRYKGIAICSWEYMTQNVVMLKDAGFQMMICDEAHYAKGGKSTGRGRAFKVLAEHIPHVVLLTGTPIKNVVSELWPLLSALDPDSWGKLSEFKRKYAGELEEIATQRGVFEKEIGVSDDNLEELKLRLSCTMIRRLKTQVLVNLPPKERVTRNIPLTGEARQEYAEIEAEFMDWLEGAIQAELISRLEDEGIDPTALSRQEIKDLEGEIAERIASASNAEALVRINKLRQVVGNLKGRAFVQWYLSGQAPPPPIIVWFYFSGKVMKNIMEELDAAGVPYVAIDQRTTGPQRAQIVDDFQAGKIPLLLATTAAKEGLTLTRANNAFFVERFWTPADETQAEDRIWRIGQERPVKITYLHVPETIDDYMRKLIESKRSTVEQVLGDDDIAKAQEKAIEQASPLDFFKSMKKRRLRNNPYGW